MIVITPKHVLPGQFIFRSISSPNKPPTSKKSFLANKRRRNNPQFDIYNTLYYGKRNAGMRERKRENRRKE